MQVFDLTQQGGPLPAIEMFRKVPNTKLLVCGGDGSVGWLLSVLDKLHFDPRPPVSVLPLGTGNDLSRSLGKNMFLGRFIYYYYYYYTRCTRANKSPSD